MALEPVTQKVIRTSLSFQPDILSRLDYIRGDMERSTAVMRILDYILMQPDYWVVELLGNKPATPN